VPARAVCGSPRPHPNPRRCRGGRVFAEVAYQRHFAENPLPRVSPQPSAAAKSSLRPDSSTQRLFRPNRLRPGCGSDCMAVAGFGRTISVVACRAEVRAERRLAGRRFWAIRLLGGGWRRFGLWAEVLGDSISGRRACRGVEPVGAGSANRREANGRSSLRTDRRKTGNALFSEPGRRGDEEACENSTRPYVVGSAFALRGMCRLSQESPGSARQDQRP
jgi:hypothetical protein